MTIKNTGVAKLRDMLRPLVENNKIDMKQNRSVKAGSNFTIKDEMNMPETHPILMASNENLEGRASRFPRVVVMISISVLGCDKGEWCFGQNIKIKCQ